VPAGLRRAASVNGWPQPQPQPQPQPHLHLLTARWRYGGTRYTACRQG
jgi:hypothetical protein